MASLSTKIKLYCEANGKTAIFGPNGNIFLQNDSDGKGSYIKDWKIDGLNQPTNKQLNSYETTGNIEETNNDVRATRKSLYPDIGDQLDDLFRQGAFSKEMSDKLQQVKSDHPKPE